MPSENFLTSWAAVTFSRTLASCIIQWYCVLASLNVVFGYLDWMLISAIMTTVFVIFSLPLLKQEFTTFTFDLLPNWSSCNPTF